MRTHFLTAIRACDKKINLKYIPAAFGIHKFMNSCCQQCQLPIACSLKNLVLSLLLEEALGPPVHCRMEGMLWALHQCDVFELLCLISAVVVLNADGHKSQRVLYTVRLATIFQN